MKREPRSGKSKPAGFTLVELMIAMAITVIVMAGLMSVFSSQQKSFAQQAEIANSQAAARSALYIMARDIRMAGFTGVPLGAENLSRTGALNQTWSVISLINDSSVISKPARSKTVGDSIAPNSNGDAIEVWGNFRRQYTFLTSAAAPASTSINVDDPQIFASSGNKFNQPGWVVIGDNGFFTEIHPLALNNGANPLVFSSGGLANGFALGEGVTTVAPMFRRIYYVRKSNSIPPAFPNPTLVVRNCLNDSCTSATTDYAELTMAGAIEDLQVSYNNIIDNKFAGTTGAGVVSDPCLIRGVEVVLTAGLYAYRDKTLNREFSSTINVRNLAVAGFNSCPIP